MAMKTELQYSKMPTESNTGEVSVKPETGTVISEEGVGDEAVTVKTEPQDFETFDMTPKEEVESDDNTAEAVNGPSEKFREGVTKGMLSVKTEAWDSEVCSPAPLHSATASTRVGDPEKEETGMVTVKTEPLDSESSPTAPAEASEINIQAVWVKKESLDSSEHEVYPTALYQNTHIEHADSITPAEVHTEDTNSYMQPAENGELDEDKSRPVTSHVRQSGNGFPSHAGTLLTALPNIQFSFGLSAAEKGHQCLQCLATFPTSERLMKHVMYHKSDRPFKVSSEQPTNKRKRELDKKFACNLCPCKFTTLQHLTLHVRTHTGEKPYICLLCRSAFARLYDLKKHTRTHTGEKPYRCSECRAAFADESNLNKHIRLHTGDKPFKCMHCKAAFNARSHLKAHTRIHTGEKPFRCEECPAAFRQSSALRSHVKIHRRGKPYKCPSCTSSFAEIGNLRKHAKVHNNKTGDDYRQHSATVSKASSSTRSGRAKSVRKYTRQAEVSDNTPQNSAGGTKSDIRPDTRGRIHTRKSLAGDETFPCLETEAPFPAGGSSEIANNGEEKPYKCLECSAAFAQETYMQMHMSYVHFGEKSFKCSECPASFEQKEDKEEHDRTHIGERPFRCSLCEATFSDKTAIRRHIDAHEDETPFECSQCCLTFTLKSTFRQHIRCVHVGERPFKCRQCDATFKRPDTLKVHMRIHTGEKPFTCSQCFAAFAQLSTLTSHIKLHTGERPLKCPLCPATFLRPYNMKKHSRIHTKDRPFQCSECFASFTRIFTLKKHSKIHTVASAVS